MKKIQFLTISVFALFLNCTTENAEVQTANATSVNIVAGIKPNGLAYDGCYTHIQIKNGNDFEMYKASSKSQALVDKIIADELAKLPKGEMIYTAIPVLISYNKTNQKAELSCGWGKKSMIDEIEITKISKQ